MTELAFYLFASLAIGGALNMVRSQNPIASLLSLVLTFFSLAAIYVLFDAHFIAAVQIIVYAGAIMVLFLFVIMLLNLGHDYRPDLLKGAWVLASSATAGLLAFLLVRVLAPERGLLAPRGVEVVRAAIRETNAVGAIGRPLFREYVVPFELTSVLLLAAIIGAVLLAKRRV